MLVFEPGEFEITLKLNTRFDDRISWLDQFWRPRTEPTTIRVKLAAFNKRVVDRGDTVEMKFANW